MNDGEMAPVWRLLIAAGVVFGIPIAGYLLIYSWFFVAPLVVLIGLGVLAYRRWSRAQ